MSLPALLVDRAHPREAVEHDAEEGPVSEPGQRAGVDAVEELPRFGRREDRRRALGDNVLRPPDGRGRVRGEDLAGDEPVAEHADRGQVLFHGQDRAWVGPNVGGHVERGDSPPTPGRGPRTTPGTAPRPARTPPASSRSRSAPRRTPETVRRRPARRRRSAAAARRPRSLPCA